jgi:hypothetical protein
MMTKSQLKVLTLKLLDQYEAINVRYIAALCVLQQRVPRAVWEQRIVRLVNDPTVKRSADQLGHIPQLRDAITSEDVGVNLEALLKIPIKGPV